MSAPLPALEPLMTVEEVCGIYRQSARTIRDWAQAGKFPQCAVKIGRDWLFDRNKLPHIAALNGETNQPA